jgi:hypothetical protein
VDLFLCVRREDCLLWFSEVFASSSGSFDACFDGVDYVLHTASPFQLNVKDAQKELIEPALQGTLNVCMASEAIYILILFYNLISNMMALRRYFWIHSHALGSVVC